MSKLPALLAAAFAMMAGAASADHLMIPHVQPADRHLVLGTVTLDEAGSVEVYDYHLAQQGELLGSEPLNGGANSDVVVDLRSIPMSEVLVVLKEGETPVEAQVVRFNRD